MKPRIGVRPIAGASTGLLLLVLASFLLLREKPSPPTAGTSPASESSILSLPGSTTVVPPAALPADTGLSAQVPSSVQRSSGAVRRKTPVARPALVGVSYRWAGGRSRSMLGGNMPVVSGLGKKTTIVLETTVTASGKVSNVRVLQGSRSRTIVDRTVSSVRSWRFERLPRNRKGASERCRITVTFRPPGS